MTTPAVGSTSTQPKKNWFLRHKVWTALIGLALIGFISMLLSPSAPSVGSGDSTVKVSQKCVQAFSDAAKVSEYQDTHEDLFPAYSACTSLDEWRDASALAPGAISDGVDPIEYAKNVCSNYADEVGNSTVCKAIAAPPPGQSYVYDIPSLLGKTLGQVTEVLGTPEKVTEVAQGDTQGDRSFEKNGLGLLVTYEVSSNKVLEFFLESDNPSGASSDKKHMLEIGNLKEDDSRYSVEFVETIGRNAKLGEYTGVIVRPK